MKTEQANLLNSLTLISLGLWGYFDAGSKTALIPVFCVKLAILSPKPLGFIFS